MLTKWAKKTAGHTIGDYTGIPGIGTNIPNPAYGIIEAKATNEEIRYIYPIANGFPLIFISGPITKTGGSSSYGVAVGSGSTPATEDNYFLENQITSGLSVTGGNLPRVTVYDEVNKKYIIRCDITLTNDSSEDITIREIGRFASFDTANSLGGQISGSANRRCFLMDRTVLNTPVVIPAGDVGVVRYEFVYG